MAQKNLRIVYANRATAVSGDTNGLSLNDYKSSTYTTPGPGPNTTITITTSGIVAGNVAIVVMLAEHVGSITASATGNGGMVSTGSVTDTSASSINGTTGIIGYGGGKYIALYTTCTSSVTSIVLTIPSGTKISRIIAGNYWSPTYNTQFGVEVGYEDQSSSERLQSGDLYTINAARHKTLSFDLQYMNETDKFKLFDIMKSLGKITPVFISIFPDDEDKEKEQMYQIYGKFTGLSSISHTMFTMYASSVQVEEI